MSDLGAVKVFDLFLGTGTAVGTSSPYRMARGPATYQLSGSATGTGASGPFTGIATVQVSNDNMVWLGLGTMTATGSSTTSPGGDGFAAVVPWAYSRLVITTLTTGIGAKLVSGVGQ